MAILRSVNGSRTPKAWNQVKASGEDVFHPHQRYWFHGPGYVLAMLLQNAGYSHQGQVNALLRFAHLAAPHLGPIPKPDMLSWNSFMTDDHNPIELSWDFHTGAQLPTIRYSIEPIALDAGTPSNPNNITAGPDFKKQLLRANPETNTTLFDHFESCFNQSWSEDVPEGHLSTVFWAFDIMEKASTPKAYFFPGTVAHATNRSNLEVIAESIITAPGYSSSKILPLATFTHFVEQRPHLNLEVDMLALDLVNENESRLKIYFRDRRTDFASVREMMSLGGYVSDPDFEEGMERLKLLWDGLFGTEGVSEDTPLQGNGHRTAGILYNVEFRAQSKTPKVKIYIPARHYAQNDQQIVNTLTDFMTNEVAGRQGLETAAMNAWLYEDCMRKTFKQKDLSNSRGIHTYVGCSVNAGGLLRVVAYINAQNSKIENSRLN